MVFGDREDPTQAGVHVLSFDAPKVMNDVADTKAKLANGALRSFLVSSGETVLTPRTHVRTCFCLLLTPLIATLNCRLVELELFGRGDSVSDACMSDTEHKSVKNSFHHPFMDVLTPSPHVVYRAKMSLHVRVRLPTSRTDCFGRASDKISHVRVDDLVDVAGASRVICCLRHRQRPTWGQTDIGPRSASEALAL